MKIVLLLLASFALTVPLLAQQLVAPPAQLESPSGPMLRAPADFSCWEIVSTRRGDTPKKQKSSRKSRGEAADLGGRQQKMVTTKTGRIIHEERIDASQHRIDVWYDAAVQYTKFEDDAVWYRADGQSIGNGAADTAYHPLPAIGYRNIDIIQPENYVGTIEYHKQSCLVFVPGGSQKLDLSKIKPNDIQKKLKSQEIIAFVDEESRHPVEIRERGETRIFQFDPPPDRMQTLPADLNAQIKKGNDGRSRLNQPAPRPL